MDRMNHRGTISKRQIQKKKNSRQVWDALVMVFQFGINMIVPIVMCTLIGVWVGKKTGIIWITVPLFFVGALAGATNIYKMVKKMIEQDSKGKNDVKKDQ